ELLNYIKGPDFPTGGYILGKEEIKKAYITGRGIITLRGKVELEEGRIIITELPYQVNKSKLVEEIANCVKTKKIEGISDLRDESDREGIRVVIELNSHANQEIILNQLYKYTQLETTFGIINLALVDGEPRILSLKGLIEEYIKHRRNVITRRTKFELEKSEKRKHIVEGLLIALKNIDEVIETIKKSENVEEARNKLISKFNLTEIQAQAILDMRLQKLTALETEKLEQENKELEDKISYLKEVLASEQKVLEIIKKELLELKEKYADERRTKIIPKPTEVKEEDLIPEEEMVVILTGEGYIKRIPLNAYRSQRRGGRGIVGIDTKEKDIVTNIIIASTHDILLFFSNKGKVYAKKVYEIPLASRYSRGKALVNVFEISKDERITAVLPMEFGKGYLFMATKKGKVKKTSMDEFLSIRKTGKIAIELEEEDELVEVKVTSGDDEILLATKFGKAIRFPEREVRAMGRATLGVKGISLVNGDEVVGIEVLNSENLEQTFLVVTENGYGKRSKFIEFPLQGRGGKGVITIKISQKTGLVAGVEGVGDEDEIIISSIQGIMIRLRVKEIPILGRNTQGVKLMRLENDKVATVVKVV
ncbi:MAG: DNA gyrase subunit A, partial [Candidatus Hydrothermarchaeota archaeon]